MPKDRSAWVNTEQFVRQFARIQNEHEILLAAGSWTSNWRVDAKKRRSIADSRRYHHRMVVAREPPELRAAISAAALKRKGASKQKSSVTKRNAAMKNATISGGSLHKRSSWTQPAFITRR